MWVLRPRGLPAGSGFPAESVSVYAGGPGLDRTHHHDAGAVCAVDEPDSNLVILAAVQEIIESIKVPLGVDRWDIRLKSEAIADARAYCLASPEYRTADIVVDPDKLETGDVLQEITVHETAHLHTWKLHELAERLANALADSMPESHREAMRKSLLEEVRQAGEETTTDVGHAYLRLLRLASVLDTPAVDS